MEVWFVAEYRSERGILIREFQGVDLDELVTMPVMGIMALMRLLVQNGFSPPRMLQASLFRSDPSLHQYLPRRLPR